MNVRVFDSGSKMTMTPPKGAILAGFTLSTSRFEEISAQSPIILTQTQSFGSNLARALSVGDDQVELVSFAPTPNFPEYPQVFFRTSKFEHDGALGTELGFMNFLVAKHISRGFKLRKLGQKLIEEGRPKLLVVHGVHSPLLKYASRAKKKYGIQIMAVLTDPPGVFRASDRSWTRALKRLDLRSVSSHLSNFDFIAALTSDLATDFAPGVPAFIFPGFAPDVNCKNTSASPSEKFVIAYAGGLSSDYGVSDLVNAFKSIEAAHLRLHIYGRGPLESWLHAQSLDDSRISYRGSLPLDQLHEKLRNTTLLVNPRRLDTAAVNHSFPSKLLEYMALGVPTISTPLPPIEPPLADHLLLTQSDGANSIRVAILEALDTGEPDLERFGIAASKFAHSHYNAQAVGRRIQTFLHEQQS